MSDQIDKIGLIRELRAVTNTRYSLTELKSILESHSWNVKTAIEFCTGVPARVSRSEVLDAIKNLDLRMYILHRPTNGGSPAISFITLLESVAKNCFIERLQGIDVEIVRIGLRQLNNEGELN